MSARFVVALLSFAMLVACRHAPRRDRRILTDDSVEGRACFAAAQESFQLCMFNRVRRGLCVETRDALLMKCPGARDVTGEPDPTVVQLPGYRP